MPAETLSPGTIEVPAAACTEVIGSIESYQIEWNGEELTGRIYTPPCYGQDPTLRYPALYLLHGATETEQQWDSLGVNEWADILIVGGEIPPLIIVMPREITWLVLPDNPFGDDLVSAVIPWIDSHFLTIDDSQYRAIGGLSRGGNWAVRLGFLHWGLFGMIGAHSTPLFIGDLQKVPGWIESIPSTRIPRIWLDIASGDTHFVETEAFHDLLTDLNIDHQWRVYPGLHDEAYWRSHIEDYLKWYSAGWGEN
jgi:enterochelin esterase-like enzyme